jgi:hypothetical protein
MAGESAEGPWSPAPRPCPRRPSTPWCRRATPLARAAKASNVCSSNMGALLLRQRMHPDGPSYNELAATLQSPAPHLSPGSRLLTKRTCPRRPHQSCHGLLLLHPARPHVLVPLPTTQRLQGGPRVASACLRLPPLAFPFLSRPRCRIGVCRRPHDHHCPPCMVAPPP